MSNDNTENHGEIICFRSLDHKMPKRRTKSKHVEGVKAKSEDSKGKSRNVRATKAKSKAKGEDKNKEKDRISTPTTPPRRYGKHTQFKKNY